MLRALGALRQKPRAQLLGALAAALIDAAPTLCIEDLAGCLSALAALRLQPEDTQGVRATTAAAAPAPAQLAGALLAASAPLLPGAAAGVLAEVLSAAGRLRAQGAAGGGEAEAPAWLAAALDGAEAKVEDADDEVGFPTPMESMRALNSQLFNPEP